MSSDGHHSNTNILRPLSLKVTLNSIIPSIIYPNHQKPKSQNHFSDCMQKVHNWLPVTNKCKWLFPKEVNLFISAKLGQHFSIPFYPYKAPIFPPCPNINSFFAFYYLNFLTSLWLYHQLHPTITFIVFFFLWNHLVFLH